MQRATRLLRTATAAVCLLLAGACTHYRAGAGGQLPFRSVFVEFPGNATDAPQVQALLSARLREHLLADGRISLAPSPAGADAILKVDLTGHRRDITAVSAQDTGLERKLSVHLTATASLVSPGGCVYMAAQAFDASRPVYTDNGQVSGEYQAMPALADAMAGLIAAAVADCEETP